ncbi:MAG: DUF4249 domain-containing protein [Mucilaginibacter sp.]
MQACKKPFTPSVGISGNNRFLVIEGIISGNDSTFIKISRTKKVDTLRTVFPESGAQVTVESDANATYPLVEKTNGTYACAPLNIDASHKYRLRIKTSDAKEYVSDFVTVKNAPPIDSVGFVPRATGVQLYVNTHDDANGTRYYRWDYTETWQFHSQYVSGYYSNGVDSINARQQSQQVYNCFGNDSSSNIVIASTLRLAKDIVYQAPLTIIAPSSEKIETKYSILVRQYALTSDAYAFWDNLQKNTEKLGSIFDVLPSQTQSNFHCISNPNELVVGYLSAGNASYKRIFITAAQLPSSYSTVYPASCELDTAFEAPNPQIPTQKPISVLIPANSPYMPVTGLFIPPDNPFGGPNAYTFSTKVCVDCTLRGKTVTPLFWQ